MRVGARVLPLALHDLGCLARSAVARRARTHRPLSWHPLAAQILPHTSRVDSGFSDFLPRHTEVKSAAFTDPGSHPALEPVRSHRKLDGYSKKVGALGFEPRTSLVRLLKHSI